MLICYVSKLPAPNSVCLSSVRPSELHILTMWCRQRAKKISSFHHPMNHLSLIKELATSEKREHTQHAGHVNTNTQAEFKVQYARSAQPCVLHKTPDWHVWVCLISLSELRRLPCDLWPPPAQCERRAGVQRSSEFPERRDCCRHKSTI